jgi:hypothetical protein
MWNRIKEWFTQDEPTNLVLPKKPYRKPSDTTPLTQGMYDFVIEMKASQEEVNKRNKGIKALYETTEELCDYLNMVFGTNFSRSKLTRIWCGHVNREKLPEGIKYTIPF